MKILRMLVYSLLTIGLIVSLSVFYAIRLTQLEALTMGEFIIGTATLLLSFATFVLGFAAIADGILNRELDRELAEKDRRRLRLKEQFEGLYSPLMSCIDIIDKQGEHGVEPLSSLMPSLRGKFEFLAKEDLKELLREYYFANIHTMRDAAWLELIGPIQDAIGTGWAELSSEYDELTGER